MEGDAAAWFCLVRSGLVKILRQSRGGKEVVLELIGPGEPFGGVAVLEGRPYPASAQAMEASAGVRNSPAPIVAVAGRHPPLARAMSLLLRPRPRSAHAPLKSPAAHPPG